MAAKEKSDHCIVCTPDPAYCGIGAGGVQFANGKARVRRGWVANWYNNHGYKVEDDATETQNETPPPPDGKETK